MSEIEYNIEKYIKDIEKYIKEYNMSWTDPQQCVLGECVSGNTINGYYGDNNYYFPTTITTTDGTYPGYYPGSIGTNPGRWPGTTGPNPGYYPYYYPTTTTGDNYWIYTTPGPFGKEFDVLNNKEVENINNLPEEIKKDRPTNRFELMEID